MFVAGADVGGRDVRPKALGATWFVAAVWRNVKITLLAPSPVICRRSHGRNGRVITAANPLPSRRATVQQVPTTARKCVCTLARLRCHRRPRSEALVGATEARGRTQAAGGAQSHVQRRRRCRVQGSYATMEAIKPVIERIVASFGEGAVSDTLAAFVARMVSAAGGPRAPHGAVCLPPAEHSTRRGSRWPLSWCWRCA